MSDSQVDKSREQVIASLDLNLAGDRIRLEVPVTTRAVRPIDLLPIFQGLADDFTKLAGDAAERQGARISCEKGCGACCRQLVPLAQTEARHIRDLVNRLSEPKRSEVLARFAESLKRLQETGMLEKIASPGSCSAAEFGKLALDYFHLGVPCPLLEEESCSIHPDRPIACREYLVSSPAANCARPTASTVEKVKLPAKVWVAVARIGEDPSARFIPWVPLIIAPSWADAHPDQQPPRPGTSILREFFARFAALEVPDVPEP